MAYNTVLTFLTEIITPSMVITLFICGGIVYLYRRYHKTSIAQTSLPTLLTVLGILGTFIGIFIGLLSFNTQNIQASVPILLEGLKTAFMTSIFGMAFAFLTKLEGAVKNSKISESHEDYPGATIDTLAELLDKIHKTQENVWSKAERQLQGIEKSLVGEGDTTLLTQLQKLRTALVDKQDDLIKEFRQFAVTMAENNSKALIEALSEVLRDFNTKINEQFGDNFKQLNEAVGKILLWQEQYKQQIEELTSQFDRSVKAIDGVKVSIGEIAEKSDSIVNATEKLGNVLTTMDKGQTELEEHLKEFAGIARDAHEVIPAVRDNMVKAADIFTQALANSSESFKRSIDYSIEYIHSQTNLLNETATRMNGNIEQTMNSVTSNVERIMDETGKQMQEQVRRLDANLQEELNKSLNTLGTQLASLSNKFVEDYSPLTDKLSKLVKFAEGVGDGN